MSQNNHKNPALCRVFCCKNTTIILVDQNWQIGYNIHMFSKQAHSMTTIAKMADGRIVEVVRVADTVSFSPDSGWVMVCFDFEKINRKREHFTWMPATTRFDWVREFRFG